MAWNRPSLYLSNCPSGALYICPLQLEVIRRGIDLWTNPGEVVLSPFAGIGSEGFVAVEMGRKFIGIELKQSYFDQAIRNIESAEHHKAQDLFSEIQPA